MGRLFIITKMISIYLAGFGAIVFFIAETTSAPLGFPVYLPSTLAVESLDCRSTGIFYRQIAYT
jgi:hypothetical protein